MTYNSKKPTKEQFRAWADAGMSARDVCAMIGVTPPTVSRWGKDFNIELDRSAWGGNRKQGYVSPEEQEHHILMRLPMPATGGRLAYWGRVE